MNYILNKILNAKFETLFAWIVRLWVLCAILAVSVVGLIIWTVCHFVAKYW